MKTVNVRAQRYAIDFTESQIDNIMNGGYVLIPVGPEIYIPFDSKTMENIDLAGEIFEGIEREVNDMIINPQYTVHKITNAIRKAIIRFRLKSYCRNCVKDSTHKAIKEMTKNARGKEYRDVNGNKARVGKRTIIA